MLNNTSKMVAYYYYIAIMSIVSFGIMDLISEDVVSYKDLEYAKTLQDLTEEDRILYYGKDILSEEGIENRIDICEEIQSKEILSEYTADTPPQKIECKEYVNTLHDVDVILKYIISEALND